MKRFKSVNRAFKRGHLNVKWDSSVKKFYLHTVAKGLAKKGEFYCWLPDRHPIVDAYIRTLEKILDQEHQQTEDEPHLETSNNN